MAHDVDYRSIRVNGKKAAHAPRLVGQWINNLDALLDSPRLRLVNVSYLNADIRARHIRFIITNDANLGGGICRRCEGNDIISLHHDLQAQEIHLKFPVGIHFNLTS